MGLRGLASENNWFLSNLQFKEGGQHPSDLARVHVPDQRCFIQILRVKIIDWDDHFYQPYVSNLLLYHWKSDFSGKVTWWWQR